MPCHSPAADSLDVARLHGDLLWRSHLFDTPTCRGRLLLWPVHPGRSLRLKYIVFLFAKSLVWSRCVAVVFEASIK